MQNFSSPKVLRCLNFSFGKCRAKQNYNKTDKVIVLPPHNEARRSIFSLPTCGSYQGINFQKSKMERIGLPKSQQKYGHGGNVKSQCCALEYEYGKDMNNRLLHFSSPKYSKQEADTLHQLIFNLQSDIRRIKRVDRSEIDLATSLFSTIETDKHSVSHGPFLLACCGRYLSTVTPNMRIEMIQAIWEKTTSPTIECYDALLKSYTSNDYTAFDPFALLDKIKEFNMIPSEETYYYSLVSFCQRGDIKSAAKILHLMKKSKMSVDERFFNALILGNFRAGDIKSAREIIAIMKTARLEPSLDSYTTLMQAHIELGNLDEVQNIYLKAIQDVSFSNDAFLKLLKVAAYSQNKQMYLQLLSWMPESEELILDLENTALEFVYSGFQEEGFLLLQKLKNHLKPMGPSFGSSYIRALIESDTDISITLNMCRLMRQEMLNEYSFYIASEACIQQKKFSMVLQLFEEMKKENVELRSHFFLPLIIFAFDDSGLEGLTKTLQKMTEFKVAPDFEIILEWILPRLFSIVESPNEVAKILKEFTGVSYTSGVLGSVVIYLLRRNQISDAAKFTKNLKSSLKQSHLVTEALVSSLIKYRKEILFNMKSAVLLMKFVATKTSEDMTDYVGQLLVKLAESIGNEQPEILSLLMKNLAALDVCISVTAFNILESTLPRQCPMKTDSELVYHVGHSFGSKAIPHPRDMDVVSLKCHMEELSAKQMNTRGTARKLFLKYCQMNDKINALKLKEAFEQNHDEISVGMKAGLLGLYTKNSMTVDALQLYNELKINEVLAKEGGVDVYKIIDLATLLISNGYIDDGINVIYDGCNKKYPPGRSKSITRNVIRLLEAIVLRLNDATITKQILDLLLANSIAEPCSPVIGVLIKQRIESKNVNTAVAEFVDYSLKYKITPAQLHLYYSILENEELLSKVFSCCSTVRGKVDAKHTLAFAKSDVGDLEGSAKIFMELGNQVKFNKIIRQSQYLIERSELSKLQNLIKAIRLTGKNYDYSRLYLIALEATKAHGDINNHRSIIENMQEQDLQIPLQHLSHFKSYQMVVV